MCVARQKNLSGSGEYRAQWLFQWPFGCRIGVPARGEGLCGAG